MYIQPEPNYLFRSVNNSLLMCRYNKIFNVSLDEYICHFIIYIYT